MTRILRGVLYWLAVMAGISGVVAGGMPLGRYLKARFTDPYFDSFSYSDPVFSGGVIVLLSLILLVFADIGLMLGRNARAAKNDKAAATPDPSEGPPRAAGILPAPRLAPETQAERASADEKLARLLKDK